MICVSEWVKVCDESPDTFELSEQIEKKSGPLVNIKDFILSQCTLQIEDWHADEQ